MKHCSIREYLEAFQSLSTHQIPPSLPGAMYFTEPKMKHQIRIREEHFASVSLFYCEKKFFGFWVPVFEHNKDEGEPPVSFGSLEKAQRAVSSYLGDHTTYHYFN